MNPEDPHRHRLSAEEHERIFREKIIRRELSGALPWRDPVVYVLAGQPGAGKSRTKSAVVQFRGLGRGGAVDLGSDTLRKYHPEYQRLLNVDDQTAAFYTNLDARQWVDEAVEYLTRQRSNIVFDTSLGRPDTAEKLLARFRDSSYRIEVAFVAVPAALSVLGNLQRWQAQVDRKGHGRIVTRPNHDAAYEGVLEVADRIEAKSLADVVHVYRRGGELLSTKHLDGAGRWSASMTTRQVIEKERSRPWTSHEVHGFSESVCQLAAEIDPSHRTTLHGVVTLAEPLLGSSATAQELQSELAACWHRPAVEWAAEEHAHQRNQLKPIEQQQQSQPSLIDRLYGEERDAAELELHHIDEPSPEHDVGYDR